MAGQSCKRVFETGSRQVQNIPIAEIPSPEKLLYVSAGQGVARPVPLSVPLGTDLMEYCSTVVFRNQRLGLHSMMHIAPVHIGSSS